MNRSPGRVVHLVPPNGGGVDRLVRDICSRRPTDWLLHLTDDQCVVECSGEDLLVPVAAGDLDRLLADGVLGRPALLHAHSTVPAVRRATQLLAQRLQLAYIVTLHDVEFGGGPDDAAHADRPQRLAFLRAAARCTVPSGFMRSVVVAALGELFHCAVLENGVDAFPTTAGAKAAGDYPIAVIGAMGPHKGLSHLLEVAAALPLNQRIVLLGYADGQLEPGWLGGGRVRVHGAFEPAQLAELAAGYGAMIAFFPAGQPESYCYALSDAWLAGLPVVGPNCGAIGERVRAHGGGNLYQPAAPVQEVVLAISRQLARVAGGDGDLAGAVASMISIDTMVGQLDAIYSQIAADATRPDLDALRRSATKHLDSRFFRKELLRLQGDLGAAQAQRDNALTELATLAGNFARRGEWIEHLEQEMLRAIAKFDGDCQQLRAGAETLGRQNAALQGQLTQFQSLQQAHAALQESMLALQTSHASLKRVVTWPLRLLPPAWRPWVARAVKRLISPGDRNG